jgi:hypothetical protein
MAIATPEIISSSPQHAAARRLHTVQQFCQAHPAFTPGGLRWLLFHRETNGLKCAIVRVGRRLLIDEDKFFAWLETQQGQDND